MSNVPCELEFIAENETIRIVPNFSLNQLYLINGTVGPFRAGLPIQVPIWLAINLRQRSKCRILIPDWLEKSVLQQIKHDELSDDYDKSCTEMPSEHYMTLGKIVLETCSGEIQNTDELRTLLKDIWDIRTSKFKKSIADFLESGGSHANIKNFTQMEISSVRPFFPHALEQIFRLTRGFNNALAAARAEPSEEADSQTTLSSSSASLSTSLNADSQASTAFDSQSQSQSQSQS